MEIEGRGMMKTITKAVSGLLATSLLSACGTLPAQSELAEGRFRIENFKTEVGFDNNFVRVMCHLKRPTGWYVSRDYPVGKHKIWVIANLSKSGQPKSEREAVTRLDVALEAGKFYRLAHERHESKVKLWIEEKDSKQVASKIVTAKLIQPILDSQLKRKKQCESSTV